MNEPVAWARIVDGCLIQLKAVDPKDARYTPLYASSYAQGVADAARLALDHSALNRGEEDFRNSIVRSIRALSSPPSVDNAWINQRIQEAYSLDIANQVCAGIEATLAALGIEVTK